MGVKDFFKNQFSKEMFSLNHENVSDFYLSCWQRGDSRLPLFVIRGVLFALSSAILMASLLVTEPDHLDYWIIYLTNWGVIMIVLSSGSAFFVSFKFYICRNVDDSRGLPWYVKMHWFIYNTTLPIAFLITIFYWLFLSDTEEDVEYAPNFVLDVFIHGINSGVMFLLLFTSRMPSRLAHFYQPFAIHTSYTIFGCIYILAGGVDALGNPWIYPMFDWSQPGWTLLMGLLTMILLFSIYLLVILLAAFRNLITIPIRPKHKTVNF